MVHYKSIDQSQFAEGTDIKQQEKVFDDFLQDTLLEIQGKGEDTNSLPYIFLKTCNRSELYYGEGDVTEEVARHLFRVVSGLESAIVGERAVQGQVKEAYYTAKDQRWLPAELHKLFQSALLVGKRVRNETEISHGAVSHSLAALEILEDEGIDLKNARITLIGVNKLTADILKFLQNKGAKMVFLANRSQIKAHYLADPLGIKVYTLDEKQAFLSHTDILISATSAPTSSSTRKTSRRANQCSPSTSPSPRHRLPPQRVARRTPLQYPRRGTKGEAEHRGSPDRGGESRSHHRGGNLGDARGIGKEKEIFGSEK